MEDTKKKGYGKWIFEGLFVLLLIFGSIYAYKRSKKKDLKKQIIEKYNVTEEALKDLSIDELKLVLSTGMLMDKKIDRVTKVDK